MVGPQDGGFGFDQSKKYTSVDNLDKICVQCQAGQHKKCLFKSKEQPPQLPLQSLKPIKHLTLTKHIFEEFIILFLKLDKSIH